MNLTETYKEINEGQRSEDSRMKNAFGSLDASISHIPKLIANFGKMAPKELKAEIKKLDSAYESMIESLTKISLNIHKK